MGATMGAGKRGEVRWKKPHLGPRLFVLPSQDINGTIQTTIKKREGWGVGVGRWLCCATGMQFPSTSTRLETILPHQYDAPAQPAFCL